MFLSSEFEMSPKVLAALPARAVEIETGIDLADRVGKRAPGHSVSAATGAGVDALRADLARRARALLPKPGAVALNQRQAKCLHDAAEALSRAAGRNDDLLVAEDLREAREAMDRLTGRASTEDMLDALFGRFCIGK